MPIRHVLLRRLLVICCVPFQVELLGPRLRYWCLTLGAVGKVRLVGKEVVDVFGGEWARDSLLGIHDVVKVVVVHVVQSQVRVT